MTKSGVTIRGVRLYGFNCDNIRSMTLSGVTVTGVDCIWCKWAGMKIRVDKCVAFGTRKSSTKSIQ